MSKVLELKNVTRTFYQGGIAIDVLRDANLTIASGEIVGLVGPSGSGKSTLLQIAGLLEAPDQGRVRIEGMSVKDNADNVRTALRRDKIGFVYQAHHLLPDFTALENLSLPQMVKGISRKQAELKASESLERVGLLNRVTHYPSELSGGEQQRVALARALINDPVILLADEPTGNLDPATADAVFELLMATVKDVGLGALIATHDMELTKRMDRVLTLKDGQV